MPFSYTPIYFTGIDTRILKYITSINPLLVHEPDGVYEVTDPLRWWYRSISNHPAISIALLFPTNIACAVRESYNIGELPIIQLNRNGLPLPTFERTTSGRLPIGGTKG